MGMVHRPYKLFECNLNVVTRTPQETHKYLPFVKASSLSMKFVRTACRDITKALAERKKIDCKLIVKKIHEQMEELLSTGFNWRFTDNLPGEVKFFYIPTVDGAHYYNDNPKRKKLVKFDVIHLAVGINYKGYYSNYMRTLLIRPTANSKYNYYFKLLVKRVILYYLRDGAELSNVYKAAIQFAESKDKNLAKHLKRHFGFALCPISHDDLVISETSKSIARYGMTFSMIVDLIDLEEDGRLYNLCNTDTVLVRRNTPAEILTNALESRI